MSHKETPHHFDERGLEATRNVRGYMHTLNEISQAFIDFAPKAPGFVVDVGAAYGVATIPILNKRIKVIACDMEKNHLEELEKRVDSKFKHYLTTKHGQFPHGLDFDQGSVGAILFSHILHFLSPDELDLAFQKLSTWLASHGKLFIVAHTPYVRPLKRFIPLYEKRCAQSIKWPAWIENNVRDYMESPQEVLDNLPATMNYLDLQPLIRALESNDFSIEKADYLDPKTNNISEELQLDGREWIGVIAVKK